MATSGTTSGHHGITPPGLRPDYKTYRSPHAPAYQIGANFHGIDRHRALRFGYGLGLFGAAGAFGALWFLADLPRFRKDIMEKIPFLKWYYHKEIAPEDNPF